VGFGSLFCERVWKGLPRTVAGSSRDDDIAVAWSSSTSWYNNGMKDDLNLTYSDPLWANILSSYRGYNEEQFRDAGKGFSDELSPHCLAYAKERGVLLNGKDGSDRQGMRFRFCGEEDEASLMSFAEKCRWKSCLKHNLATCLRSQSQFCIVAELPQSSSSSSSSSFGRPIAFLQYRFCWYLTEEKHAGNVTPDKVSELVIFIDSLVFGGAENFAAAADPAAGNVEEETTLSNTVSSKELETAKVLLISLALVHAARAGIWYGMMESPCAICYEVLSNE